MITQDRHKSIKHFSGFSLPGSLRPSSIRFLFCFLVLTYIYFHLIYGEIMIATGFASLLRLTTTFTFAHFSEFAFAAASNCNHISSARNKIISVLQWNIRKLGRIRQKMKRNKKWLLWIYTYYGFKIYYQRYVQKKLKLIKRIETRLSLSTWGCIFRGILMQGKARQGKA